MSDLGPAVVYLGVVGDLHGQIVKPLRRDAVSVPGEGELLGRLGVLTIHRQ